MALFQCEECGVIENTGYTNYWMRNLEGEDGVARCSECEPDIGEWHGSFPRNDAHDVGMLLDSDGFLWHPDVAEGEKERFKLQGIEVLGVVPAVNP